MSGKMCNGISNKNSFRIKANCHRAFSEGMHRRAEGTAAAFPISGNPHDGKGTENEAAWDAGWNVAHSAAGGVITVAAAGCAARPIKTILA